MGYSDDVFAQLSKPSGDVGLEVLDHLNRVNAGINTLTLNRVQAGPGARILEIGFGGGALIQDGLRRFPDTTFVGADISELAVAQAKQIFREEIDQGRADFFQIEADRLPFDSAAFDGVISVNVIYFVPDLPVHTGEVARLIKPGGHYVVSYSEGSPDGITKFPPSKVEALLTEAGFQSIDTQSAWDEENDRYHCTSAVLS